MLRFLLYNIRYAAGMGSAFHLPFPYAGYLRPSSEHFKKIMAFIAEMNPDIIGLVEVDSGSFRTGRQSQAALIAQELGYDYVGESKYGVGAMASRLPVLKSQGNAVLSRMPIISHRFQYFDEGVKRLIIQACTEHLTVFLVHLSLTYRKRQYQLERLYRLIRKVQRPVFLAGDFNVLWGSREMELFLGATGLCSVNHERIPSHPSDQPTRELDFILHSPELRPVRFFSPTITLSDHAPLVCDFEMC
ncbi:MAG: endonuclease [Desulfobulbaceae bacterium]|nr:endonuclease [Desulfobulbaceae bacterium]